MSVSGGHRGLRTCFPEFSQPIGDLLAYQASHDFGVVGRVIGYRGSNMKRIAGGDNPDISRPNEGPFEFCVQVLVARR